MRSWPISRKLLVVPCLALLLLLLTALWTLASLRHHGDDLRIAGWIAAGLGLSGIGLLAMGALFARGISRRLDSQRETLAHLVVRGKTQMRRSTEFLELAQAAGGFGVFDLDLVTGQVIGSPLFFELISMSDPQALFTRDEWLATLHPEDFERVLAKLNAAITAAGRFDAEYRCLLTGGGVRWLSCRGQVLEDAEGYPAHAIGTLSALPSRTASPDLATMEACTAHAPRVRDSVLSPSR